MTALENIFLVLLIVSVISGALVAMCALEWLITKLYPKWDE